MILVGTGVAEATPDPSTVGSGSPQQPAAGEVTSAGSAAQGPVFGRVMVTGHRPHHLDADQQAWSQVMLARVAAQLAGMHGARHCISGLALGADTWWAVAGLAAGMRLHVYVPFEAQAAKWSGEQQALWRQLRAAASREVLVGGRDYDVRMLHARNDAMLADADLVVALLRSDATSGGTHSTVSKGRHSGRPMLLLDPVTQRVDRVGW